MSRKIKFRVWDSIHKRMIPWDQVKILPDAINLIGGANNQLVPLQYVRLNDQSDTEVYEGDIIETSTPIGSSRYYVSDMCLTHPHLAAFGGKICGIVVGNIYDNPELLEGSDL